MAFLYPKYGSHSEYIKIKAGTKFDPLLSKNNDLNLKHII